MRRGRGNIWGDEDFNALKSVHGKFKIEEIESHQCYGSWNENCKNVKRLIEKEWK